MFSQDIEGFEPTQPQSQLTPMESTPDKSAVWARLVSVNDAIPNIELDDHKIDPIEGALFGRHKDCDFRFQCNAVISGKHCRIYKVAMEIPGGRGNKTEDVVYVEDLSMNGTYVNGQKLGRGNRRVLSSQDEIALVKPADKKKTGYVGFVYIGINRSANEYPLTDRYEERGILGTGNYGIVKSAIDKHTGQPVAVKIIIKKRIALDNAGSAAALAEFDLMKKLTHKNIIQINECFETEKAFVLVMEQACGGELFEKVAVEGRVSEDLARHVVQQILEAIHYLHSKNIIHRDMKPENVLIFDPRNMHVKVTDFGLAKILGDRSMAKTFCGTPEYFAPEMLQTEDGLAPGYGKSIDVWSVGVILFILLSGKQPFKEGEGRPPLFKQIMKGEVSTTGRSWAGVSQAAKDLVASMLTANPKKRVTVEEALTHPWFKATGAPSPRKLAEEFASGSSLSQSESKRPMAERVASGSATDSDRPSRPPCVRSSSVLTPSPPTKSVSPNGAPNKSGMEGGGDDVNGRGECEYDRREGVVIEGEGDTRVGVVGKREGGDLACEGKENGDRKREGQENMDRKRRRVENGTPGASSPNRKP
eukprot:Rmarinus@m.21704